MSTSRETVRDALVIVLAAALVGDGLPCKTVTGSHVDTVIGLSPLVSVLGTGTLREPMTWQGHRPTFTFEVQVWVLGSGTSWTHAQAEDALDTIEALIAGAYESNQVAAEWETLQYNGSTEVLDMVVAGTPYLLERIPTIVQLAVS